MEEPCAVCGNRDMNLVDGFYYCNECGTQDTNVRETVVEQTMLADGTVQLGTKRKIQMVEKEGIEMSGEWYKWHTFNFILTGLVDELISLGAKPSIKMKVLWVWVCYINKFQNKEALGLISSFLEESLLDKTEKGDFSSDSYIEMEKKPSRAKKSSNTIKNITTNLLLSILYVSLNLDKSEIQLSHLFRFVREGRLSLLHWAKFIPKEIKVKRIPEWIRFEKCYKECSRQLIHQNSANLFKTLNLGAPILPDINKIVENFITELCLPSDFRNLVLSIINFMPCDFLILKTRDIKKITKVPDYEITVMAYVLIGLKMCFGLDDDYEIKLSNAVDHVNESGDEYVKAYKLGALSNSTSRLFSFRDWCKYLQLRKMILSRFYLPMAWQYNVEADDYIFMEQSTCKPKGKSKVSDEVTMDILNRIPHIDEGAVIPKSEFLASLTPMTTYIDVILQYFQDPELKLILSEDFSQYSLKYTIEDMSFPSKFEDFKDVLVGVGNNNKMKKDIISGTLVSSHSDFTEVYVRNCDNKNWLKTNPPTVDHVKKVEHDSDKETDHGYDSPTNSDVSHTLQYNEQFDETLIENCEKVDVKLEFITEEDVSKCIFDDEFDNIKEERIEEQPNENVLQYTHEFEFDTSGHNVNDSKSDINSFISRRREFDPNNFNRSNTIKELILLACRDLKMPIPKEYNQRETQKRPRKRTHVTDEASAPKRKRTKHGEAKREIEEIMSAYYSRVEHNLLNQISQHIVNTLGHSNPTDDLGDLNQINPDIEEQANLEERQLTVTEENNEIQNSEFNSTSLLDPTVLENSDAGSEIDLAPSFDPKYDENTHDIRQLYVKIHDNEEIPDPLDIENDPDVLKIIDEKICQFSKEDIEITKSEYKTKTTENNSDSDSEDDVPLKILQEEMKIKLQNEKHSKESLESLVKNKNITTFNYWLRHYTSDNFRKRQKMNAKFNIEMQTNFPKSFKFVIEECASILNCQAFMLYKTLQSLEQKLVSITMSK